MTSPGPYRKLFPPELRTAAIVPRWSIVQTLRTDMLSSHSFFVTFYARQIAKLIGWKGNYEDLMYYALVHDLGELITGDIVSPAKAAIVDIAASDAYIADKMFDVLPDVLRQLDRAPDIGMQQIVKAADRLDAVLFLIVEQRLGNTIIENRLRDCYQLLKESWWLLPGLIEQQKKTTWATMEAEISWHKDLGGAGV